LNHQDTKGTKNTLSPETSLNNLDRSKWVIFSSSKSSLVPLVSWWFNLALVLVLSGCAGTPPVKTDEDEVRVKELLTQAASRFAVPNSPIHLTLQDEAEVQWNHDKSMRVTVRQLWATRTAPERPLPPIATVNQDSQALTIRTLRLFDLDPTAGTFKPTVEEAKAEWVAPGKDLTGSLSKIFTVQPPKIGANQALEVIYTLDTKISSLLQEKDPKEDPTKPHPVAAESSFAFLWNDHVPSVGRKLTLRTPQNVDLFGGRLRLPKELTTAEEELKEGGKVVRLSLEGPKEPLPSEGFQPPLQDLAPLTAFTVHKTWDEALLGYRKGVKRVLDGDLGKVQELLEGLELEGSLTLQQKAALIKEAFHKKMEWVDTGLPVYLNPVRTLEDMVNSGKGTSHDMAVLLACCLKWNKIPSQVYLYRRSGSGDLISDLPALSQMDGVLVAVPVSGSILWMDPTEPLAPAGTLPLQALGEQALAVLGAVSWKTTPSFGARDHRKERDITMEFLPNNKLRCAVDLKAFGSNEVALRQFFRSTTEETRRDAVLKGLSKRLPGVVLTDYRYGDWRNLAEPLGVRYVFEVESYAKAEKGGGFSFHPIVFEDVDDFLATLRKERRTPVLVPQNFNSVTRVLVKLPEGYKPGELPKDGSVSNPMAEFISSARLQFGTITYERYLGLKKRRIEPGKEYGQLQDFYQAVLTQDRVPFKAVKGK